MLTHSYDSTGVVASGALCYARCPLVEECVATRHLAFTYLGDYHHQSGKRLKSGILQKGLGWVIRAVRCFSIPIVWEFR
jgi:hypothetical protein